MRLDAIGPASSEPRARRSSSDLPTQTCASPSHAMAENKDEEHGQEHDAQDESNMDRERGWTITDLVPSVDDHGRQYQGFMPNDYSFPNDGEEQDRLDFQHAGYVLMLGGRLGLAPVQAPRHVLDIGTGTGIWAIEYAQQNPDTMVIGTDLSLIQPVPQTPNCRFIQENSETQEWVFAHPFDYVHLRSMAASFRDIRTVFRKAYDAMAPGAWIEVQDGLWELSSIDETHHGSALEKWFATTAAGAASIGHDVYKVNKYHEYLGEAGFSNVLMEKYVSPLGPWTQDARLREMGMYLSAAMLAATRAGDRLLRAAGMSEEDIRQLPLTAADELADPRRYWYMTGVIAIAQKPHEDGSHSIKPEPYFE